MKIPMIPIIRSARKEDATFIWDTERFWASTPGYLVSHPDEIKLDVFLRKIEELSNSRSGIYRVATDESGRILGHALLEPMGLKAISHVVRLTIVLHPGNEERGIGTLLMENTLNWAKETPGVEKIELLVRSSNQRAIALYQKFGFREEGRLIKRIKISEDTYLDDITMALMTK